MRLQRMHQIATMIARPHSQTAPAPATKSGGSALDLHRSRRDLRPERHDVRSARVLHEHHFEDPLGRMEPWTECRTERGQRRERHRGI